MGEKKSFVGIGRGNRIKKEVDHEERKLSTIFANIVTGKHLRDVKFMLVGAQGSGKSRSLLYLAMQCAEKIAGKIGGSPEDYFPSDLSNCVIGDPQGHAELFQNLKQYSIIILDDAGVSMNARNFATAYNKSMNDVFQTMRPNRSIVLISTPDSMTTDVIVRNLVSFQGEVAESYHGLGYNDVKVFRVHRKFRTNETHYYYFNFGADQVVRYRFRNPPAEIIRRYEQKRLEATRDIASRAGKEKEKLVKPQRDELFCHHVLSDGTPCGHVWTPRSGTIPRKCPKCYQPLKQPPSPTCPSNPLI